MTGQFEMHPYDGGDRISLLSSGYLGGSDNEHTYGVAVDHLGNAYIAGNTTSLDFPVIHAGKPFELGSEMFVAKVGFGSSLAVPMYAEKGVSVNDLLLAPNPVSDHLKVIYMLPKEMPVTIEICAIDRRALSTPLDRVAQAAGSHSELISAGGLAPDIYVLRLIAGNSSIVRRFVVAP